MLNRIAGYLTAINEFAGKLIGWMIVPLAIIAVMEVVLRYAFNMPTIWAWDVNVMIVGVFVAIGAGYCLLHGGFITMDVLVVRLSPRTRALVELIVAPIVLFAGVVLVWQCWETALRSLAIKEKLFGIWSPPLYPLKIIIAVGLILLLLQIVANLIISFNTFRHPKEKAGETVER